MAVTCGTIFTVLLYISHLKFTYEERVLGKEDDEFDFDGLPGAHHEFKIEIAAGKEDCFIQKVAKGASLHISFEVLRGGDRLVQSTLRNPYLQEISYHSSKSEGNYDHKAEIEEDYYYSIIRAQYEHNLCIITEAFAQSISSHPILNGGDKVSDFYLKDEVGSILEYAPQSDNANFEYEVEEQGNYQICIDNTFSRFSSKLVYVYIVTFIMEEWSKYVKEIQEVNTAVVNFTTSISEVQKSIEQMVLHQTQSRMMVIKDWYLITGNNSYVMYWSFFQIGIILTASCFQVFFVRRLFSIPKAVPGSKPRA